MKLRTLVLVVLFAVMALPPQQYDQEPPPAYVTAYAVEKAPDPIGLPPPTTYEAPNPMTCHGAPC